MTTAREPTQAGPRAWGSGLARAAVLVAAVTVAARVVGFGRWLVFSKTVGDTCLGDAYNTANQLPNVAFEIVAGGALASVVVPLLAVSASRGATGETARTLSALLTWTLLVLTPVTVLAAVLAGPYADLMLAGHAGPAGCGEATAGLAASMLVIFAPQMWFYGVAMVVSGALQAQRRFLAAALAPLASSVVVIAAYAGFVVVAGGALGEQAVSGRAVAVLAGGTSLGVVAMAGTVLVAFARVKGPASPIRPALRFPPGVAARARRLAAAGMLALVAQQLVALVLTWLANHRGEPGTLTLYTWAYALFTLPYAVLVVPIATTVFPHAAALASAAPPRPDHPDHPGRPDRTGRAEPALRRRGPGGRLVRCARRRAARRYVDAAGQVVRPRARRRRDVGAGRCPHRVRSSGARARAGDPGRPVAVRPRASCLGGVGDGGGVAGGRRRGGRHHHRAAGFGRSDRTGRSDVPRAGAGRRRPARGSTPYDRTGSAAGIRPVGARG